jgi:hypothetical protein
MALILWIILLIIAAPIAITVGIIWFILAVIAHAIK